MIKKYRILNDLKNLLAEKLGSNLKDVILFGSRAYGKPHSDSDYDFLVILKEIPDWHLRRKISEYCYEIDLKYEIYVDLHILSEQEFDTLRGRQPIFQTAIKEGIYA